MIIKLELAFFETIDLLVDLADHIEITDGNILLFQSNVIININDISILNFQIELITNITKNIVRFDNSNL